MINCVQLYGQSKAFTTVFMLQIRPNGNRSSVYIYFLGDQTNASFVQAFEMQVARFQPPSQQMVNILLQQVRIPMYTSGKMKLIAGLTEVKLSP